MAHRSAEITVASRTPSQQRPISAIVLTVAPIYLVTIIVTVTDHFNNSHSTHIREKNQFESVLQVYIWVMIEPTFSLASHAQSCAAI